MAPSFADQFIPPPKKNASKETAGKLPVDLNPLDIIFRHGTPAYQEGLVKYRKESWRDGFPISDMFAACQRHLELFFYEGQDYDVDTLQRFGIKKHHLGAVMFCVNSMLQTLETRPDLDDRPKRREHHAETSCDYGETGVRKGQQCDRKDHRKSRIPLWLLTAIAWVRRL